ncbi:MAG TPA: ATP-binding cassette domain-containing protein [Acidimicrobiales bacterium]|nr:ATP-binding cassette domain-containing protein [Acidimicrobiales bacterium]
MSDPGPGDPAARRQLRRAQRQARNAELDAEIEAEQRAKRQARAQRRRGEASEGPGAVDVDGLAQLDDLDDLPRGPARLEIRQVVVDFGGLRAVDTVSLTVEPGTITGLVGPNGSGKTTLLDTVSGQVAPTDGALLLDGRDLVDYLPEERARMGMVRSFQDCRLYPELTVEDTLLLCEDARHRIDILSTTLQLPWAREAERAKRAAVDRVIGSFGLERFRNHLTGHLSTGTRRVVDLASIVLVAPRILLLDEPTAGIAQREAEAFIPLLRRLHEVTGATILIVEHDVPLVFELCSTVVVMQSGSVVAAGDPETVRRDPVALAAYLGASDAALQVTGPVRAAQAQAGSGGRAGP